MIISPAQSKIFLFPRSIDSCHLAPIRQVVICVEGIEISIVAVRLPPGIADPRGTRLKRRERIKGKKTFIKKDEDWRADLYVLSLDERQPLLSIVERVGSALCACRGQKDGGGTHSRGRVLFSNQHSYRARVLHLTVFLPDTECVFKRRASLFYGQPNRASVAGELNELPFFFVTFLFSFFLSSFFILFSFIRIYTSVTQCFATPRLSAF